MMAAALAVSLAAGSIADRSLQLDCAVTDEHGFNYRKFVAISDWVAGSTVDVTTSSKRWSPVSAVHAYVSSTTRSANNLISAHILPNPPGSVPKMGPEIDIQEGGRGRLYYYRERQSSPDFLLEMTGTCRISNSQAAVVRAAAGDSQ